MRGPYDVDPYDGPVWTTITHRVIKKARKEHICDLCGKPIPRGSSYRLEVGLDDDGQFSTMKHHLNDNFCIYGEG